LPELSHSQEFHSAANLIEEAPNPSNGQTSVLLGSKLSELWPDSSSGQEGLSVHSAKKNSIKYSFVSVSGVHANDPPLNFDHNFLAPKLTMASLPKHLPPIRELSAQSQVTTKTKDSSDEREDPKSNAKKFPHPAKTLEVVQPQIKVSSSKTESSSSAETEGQNRFQSQVLTSNSSCEFQDLNTPVSKKVLKPPFLIRVQDGEAGSDTTSPLSSPSTSSYDDDEAKAIHFLAHGPLSSLPPVMKTSSLKHRKRSSKVAAAAAMTSITTSDDTCTAQDKDMVTLTSRRLPKKKSVSMASLVSSKESDSEDNKNLRSLKVERRFLNDNVLMTSMSRESFDAPLTIPKSMSMACLAAATVTLSHPIMITEARSRSYLVGSVGHTSMLGTDELERHFPGKKLRLFVGSWNMNGQTPPIYLADFLLPQNIEFVPDLLVIGTQESMGETKEWEARLQETLGPSHVLFHSHSLGTIHLAIFLRRELIWFCSVPEVDSFSTRPGANFKTKGAVAIAFILFGTSFVFVNSHLTAHQDNVQDRVKDLMKINTMLSLPKTLPIRQRHRNFADNFDVAFWCGDLNFRIDQTREVIIRDIRDGASVLEFDQLNYLRSEGLVFPGYIEDPIRFLPTYKYDPGTNNFDTSSKQRVPACTDRILYKSHKSTPITPLHYDIVQGVLTSDHKPVWGMWETLLRPGKDNVPLSGGLFNREIYLEGLKRRSEALKPLSKGRLNICSVQ